MTTQSNGTNGLAEQFDVQQNHQFEEMQQQQQQIQQQQQQQIQMCTRERPPQIMRPSRASRHFKNPPQPHMCIKDYTHDGQELFINVMSWTKICMPQNASDPIPLYGGMRVHSISPRSPPLVYAVMANPDILKHVGRKCTDAEEKVALVELMCDFVEAMNPGLKLARDAEVLKDRDLSGELKDIWGAVQAKREREKDPSLNYNNYTPSGNETIYIEFGPETSQERRSGGIPPPPHEYNIHNQISDEDLQHLANLNLSHDNVNHAPPPSYDAIQHDKIITMPKEDANNMLNMENHQNNETTKSSQLLPINPPPAFPIQSINNAIAIDEIDTVTHQKTPIESNTPTTTPNEPITKSATNDLLPNVINQSSPSNKDIDDAAGGNRKKSVEIIETATPIATPTPTIVKPINPSSASIPSSTKKEKIGGFLPNSCHNIFPFMKSKSNNEKKHQKDKEENQKNSKKSIKLNKDENVKSDLVNSDLNKLHNN